MCMLTYFPPGVLPDMEALENGARFNEDGHGFAIVSRGRLIVRHDNSATKILAKFKQLRAEMPEGPAIFHSRLGTHGNRNSRANCHPFRVGGDYRTVVAHNGILPAALQPGRGDSRSDTRIAAATLFARTDLSSEAERVTLASIIGRANKLVFLTVDPRYSQNTYMINADEGFWHEGVWYSNTDYEGYDRYGKYGYDFRTDTLVELCHECLSDTIEEDGYCWTCGACNDCCQPAGECLCYSPGKSELSSLCKEGRATHVKYTNCWE